VLLEHLVAFGFIYPGRRDRVPRAVMTELISRLAAEVDGDSRAPAGAATAEAREWLCGGTLLSRSQYLIDVRHRGYRDARLPPTGTMTPDQIAAWTDLAEKEAAAELASKLSPPQKRTRTRRRTP